MVFTIGQKPALTHGHSSNGKVTSTYSAWAHMLQRCFNSNDKRFKHYGGRGITVCKRWLVFENFLEDMGEAPTGLSLDRRDNNGNYSKENCRWSTVTEQNNNRSNSHRFAKDLKSLCIGTGVNYKTVHTRLSRGWDLKDALYKGVQKHGR